MKKMGKAGCFISGMLVAMLIMQGAVPAMAGLAGKMIEVYTGVNIYVDAAKLEPKDANGNPVEAFVYNGTTYLPVRAVGEAVGKTVQWEGKTGSVYLGKHTGEKPAVWLKDLDYFTGEKWSVESTSKDNLGKTRTNCITISKYFLFDNTYRINGQYSLLTGTLYQTYDNRNEESNGYLQIYGDGELLYEARMNKGVDPIDFSVDIRGILSLEIKFKSSDDGWDSVAGVCISDCGLWT